MKRFKVLVGLLLTFLLSLTMGIVNVSAAENEISNEFNLTTWGGCYGNFGVSELEGGGISASYDGHYNTALTANYVKVNFEYVNFLESVSGESGWAQEGIFNFALLTKQYTDPDWGKSIDGLYILTRNLNGALYVEIDSVVSGSTSRLYNMTTELSVADIGSFTVEKAEDKVQIGFNETVLVTADITPASYSDENGYTFFAMQTYRAGSSLAESEQTLINLYNIDLTKPAEENPKEYAEYINNGNWNGTYGAFGTTEKWNGLTISYDGWYVKALTPDYIKTVFSFDAFLKSVPNNAGGYSQEAIFEFALLKTQNVAPGDWGRSADGLYLMMRNIEGKLYVNIGVTANGANVVYYEATTETDVSDVSSFTIAKTENGVNLFINDTLLVREEATVTANIDAMTYCDANGYTFLSMHSFSNGGSGTDADKRLMTLSYIANYEGQVPDPSVTEPYKPVEGEEDYDAPVGLGLTAKKYSSATQLADGVEIQGTSVLYTALQYGYITLRFDLSVNSGESVIFGFGSLQQVYETAPLYIEFAEDNGTYAYRINGGKLHALADVRGVLLVLRKGENGVIVSVNGTEEAETAAEGLVGEYGIFAHFKCLGESKIKIERITDCYVGSGNAESDWVSPFNGVTDEEDKTVIYAHARFNHALNNDYIAMEFSIKGLVDSATVESFICVALLAESAVADPLQPTSAGIYVSFRIMSGKLQVKGVLNTAFMGQIALFDYTTLDIDATQPIKVIFLKDEAKDGYRLFINNYEFVSENMAEIITADASDRNERAYLSVALWHDSTRYDEDIFAARSIYLHRVDNLLDADDIPENPELIGKKEEIPPGDSSSENNGSSGIDKNTSSSEQNQRGCCGSVAGISITAMFIIAAGVLVGKRRGKCKE